MLDTKAPKYRCPMPRIDSKHVLAPLHFAAKPQLLLMVMIISFKIKAAYFASCRQKKPKVSGYSPIP